jgi:dTDP-4-dehydrorhamnose reductase
MKILVTGAYGQLGSEFKEVVSEYPGWTFLFTDADTLDITNETVVQDYFQKNLPEFVINCAAYTAVDKAEKDKEVASRINAEAPGILTKAAKNIKAKVIHISTDYVFNGLAFQPYTEEDFVEPTGVYGKTKLEGEKRCLAENSDSIIIRTSWLYSSFGNNFVKTMLKLGEERDSLNVIFDQVGTPTYAADLAGAILSIIKLAEKEPEKLVPGIYHYSNEGVASWYDFAKIIFEIANLKCKVNPILTKDYPTAAKRPHFSVLNKSKIKDTFGLKIPYWRDSLHLCIKKIRTK